MSNMLANPRQILNSFLKQRKITNNDIYLKPLHGGRSGAGLFTFLLDKKVYVLRMFAEMEVREGRKREALITSAVAKYGFSPSVHYIDADYLGMIIDFVPGNTLTPKVAKKPEYIKLFAKFLSNLHALNIDKVTADGYFKRSKNWLLKAMKNQANFPSILPNLVDKINEIAAVVCSYKIPQKLIHGDLISRNIILNAGNFTLIDWPAAGFGNPYWDFIDYVDFQLFDDAEIRMFLESYFSRELKQQEWDLFVVQRPVPSLVRVIGSFAFMPDIQSKEIYNEMLNDPKLMSFNKLINDFADNKLKASQTEITCAFLKEAQRQLTSKEFQEAYSRLSHGPT